jgi:hypothetical protein
VETLAGPGHPRAGGITAGSFYQEGERVFWETHDPEETVAIRLRDERYARLVI